MQTGIPRNALEDIGNVTKVDIKNARGILVYLLNLEMYTDEKNGFSESVFIFSYNLYNKHTKMYASRMVESLFF